MEITEEKQVFKVVAVVRPARLADIEKNLLSSGLGGMTIIAAKGLGEEKQFTMRIFAGNILSELERTKIEIIATADKVDKVVDILVKQGRTDSGKPGDGIVYVLPVEKVLRIRTGKEGL